MLSNGNGSKCGFEDVMVSYIYDEIAAAERRKFESHLVDCSVCTDEFASISNARFSVFEWQKEEFAQLSTPEIVIPYAGAKTVEEETPVGFLAGIRGLFGGFDLPVRVAAALIICLGAGFAAITFLGRGEQQIAANVKIEKTAAAITVKDENSPQIGSVPSATEIGQTRVSEDMTPTSQEPRAVKVVENRRSRPERQNTSRAAAVGSSDQKLPRSRKTPVLSNFDDNDDRSLRLADLFAEEIGGGR